MKKFISLLLVALLWLSLCACGDSADTTAATPTPEPAPELTPSEAEGTGSYRFTELAVGSMLEIPFTVVLKVDGSYAITETDPVKGNVVYEGDSFTWSDTYLS